VVYNASCKYSASLKHAAIHPRMIIYGFFNSDGENIFFFFENCVVQMEIKFRYYIILT
jgi:hypothetical protein